jgi:hypothetical protein
MTLGGLEFAHDLLCSLTEPTEFLSSILEKRIQLKRLFRYRGTYPLTQTLVSLIDSGITTASDATIVAGSFV